MKLYLIPFLTIILSSCSKLPSIEAEAAIPPTSIPCNVTSVHDGDTIRANCEGNITKIRLCGIDAPELKQNWGVESRDKLRSLILSSKNRINIIPLDKDRYGRLIAEIFLSDERFAQEELLKTGNAYMYRAYSDTCPNKDAMEKAESIGKNARLGVWSSNDVKPWNFRKGNS